ncbi:hypothetical protein B0H14DRAFT_3030222 [Mycena olivaceomarginata]|nr:hypothetical protein B0H14DRAFT_3030222 [Mycena olivaceomarginata]
MPLCNASPFIDLSNRQHCCPLSVPPAGRANTIPFPQSESSYAAPLHMGRCVSSHHPPRARTKHVKTSRPAAPPLTATDAFAAVVRRAIAYRLSHAGSGVDSAVVPLGSHPSLLSGSEVDAPVPPLSTHPPSMTVATLLLRRQAAACRPLSHFRTSSSSNRGQSHKSSPLAQSTECASDDEDDAN